MNKRQKIVQEQFLNNEEAVIRRLKSVYNQAQKDIEKKAQALQEDINRLGTLAKLSVDDEEKAKFLSMQQSKIYQKQYQDAMKKQIGSVLDNMQVEEFKTVSEYLQKCYEDGFVGTMFDLQGQGIPLCFPMDQEAMVRAVQLDSKISNGLYSRLGEDVAMLKRKISAQVSRGIATGMSFQQVAQQLSATTNIGFNNAVRIARTEGHRIQVQSGMDACYKAKEKGADVVKQWDSTLDSRTRDSHVAVDGEIRELDEKFSNGLMFPGDPSGGAAEVVNCRCALLQRARWALDEDELQALKDRAEFFGLDKTENFEDYRKKYLKLPKDAATMNVDLGSLRKELRTISREMAGVENDLAHTRRLLYYSSDKDRVNARIAELQNKLDTLKSQANAKGKLLVENMNTTFKASADSEDFVSLIVELDSKTEYKEVMKLASDRTFDEIIQALAGGDNTSGSCASVGLGYIGQKNGWDVLDFRDGSSRDWFGGKMEKVKMWKSLGIDIITEDSAKTNLTNGKRILSRMEKGKEYYLSVGRHASIVRKNDDGVLQYLELQSARNSGWTDFVDVGETLKWRFGCSSSSANYSTAYLTDIDSVQNNAEFRTILGYINTSESMQRKGKYGTIK